MGRPKKKVVESQGDETTKIEPTKVKEVKNEKTEVVRELRRGTEFLVVKDGKDVYMTKAVLDVAIKRNMHSIVIPKGSPYVISQTSNCKDCG
jgi:hypothetical protein